MSDYSPPPPPPPLTPPGPGRLVFEDGSTVPLDRDLVIGREPQNAPEVQSGAAASLALPDPGQSVSRVHARITLAGGAPQLQDAGSANGTFVVRPGATEWERLQGEGVLLTPGTSILVGYTILRYEL
jgi:predicted component of type VI protein secretion system